MVNKQWIKFEPLYRVTLGEETVILNIYRFLLYGTWSYSGENVSKPDTRSKTRRNSMVLLTLFPIDFIRRSFVDGQGSVSGRRSSISSMTSVDLRVTDTSLLDKQIFKPQRHYINSPYRSP